MRCLLTVDPFEPSHSFLQGLALTMWSHSASFLINENKREAPCLVEKESYLYKLCKRLELRIFPYLKSIIAYASNLGFYSQALGVYSCHSTFSSWEQ